MTQTFMFSIMKMVERARDFRGKEQKEWRKEIYRINPYQPRTTKKQKEERTIKEQTFITVTEVAEIMGISKSYAYKIVHKLNEDLKAMGYLTIAGRVNRGYFLEKTCYSPGRSSQLSPIPGGQIT